MVAQGTVSKLIHRYRTSSMFDQMTLLAVHEHLQPMKTSCCTGGVLGGGKCQHLPQRAGYNRAVTLQVFKRTVHRRPLSRGLRAKRPTKKPPLTRDRKQRRLEWALQHHNRRPRHWRDIVSSDESRFLLHGADVFIVKWEEFSGGQCNWNRYSRRWSSSCSGCYPL